MREITEQEREEIIALVKKATGTEAMRQAAKDDFEGGRDDLATIARLFGDSRGATAEAVAADVRQATSGWTPARMLRALRWSAVHGKATANDRLLGVVAGMVAGLIEKVAADRWTEAEARADAAEATLVRVGATGFGSGGPQHRM